MSRWYQCTLWIQRLQFQEITFLTVIRSKSKVRRNKHWCLKFTSSDSLLSRMKIAAVDQDQIVDQDQRFTKPACHTFRLVHCTYGFKRPKSRTTKTTLYFSTLTPYAVTMSSGDPISNGNPQNWFLACPPLYVRYVRTHQSYGITPFKYR